MRSITEITSDLQAVAKDITEANVAVEEAKKTLGEHQNALSNHQEKARNLRVEMEEYLNLLIPASQRDRVRVSG